MNHLDGSCGITEAHSDSDHKPQIYVFLSDGGILDWEVTRGDIDVVSVDWENMERNIDDWEEVRAELERLPEGTLRTDELKAVQEQIDRLRERERWEEEAEAKHRAHLEAARQTLRDAGELA